MPPWLYKEVLQHLPYLFPLKAHKHQYSQHTPMLQFLTTVFTQRKYDPNLKDENLFSRPNTWNFKLFLWKESLNHIQSLTSYAKKYPPTAINQDKHMPNTNFILETSGSPETKPMKVGKFSTIQINAF